jgi:hypothetical protein
LWKLVYLSDYILQQTLYFRRSIIEELNYIREDLHYAMDWDILIRIGKRRPLHYIPEYMGCLREYAEAKSFSGGPRRIREIARVLREHTGVRYPPGYVVYGLETYRNVWSDWVEDWTPSLLRPLTPKVRQLIHLLCGYCIDRSIHSSQGWYSDSWAAPVMKYMLPASGGGRAITLAGSIPSYKGGVGQTLKVMARGQELGRCDLPPGEFEWRLPMPERPGTGTIELTIKAARSFVPKERGGGPDSRRLAYMLRTVTDASA